MYLKALSLFKFLLFFAFAVLISGCAANISNPLASQNSGERYISRLMVPGQLPAPQSIQSVQLHRKGDTNNPPVIKLGTNEKLVLAFDELSDLSGQFRVTFTHHNKDWEISNLPSNWYMEGNNELIIGEGQRNRLSAPVYHHYSKQFPGNDVQFIVSGNYMLHVADFESGTRLFSLPFFVTENEGKLTSWVETLYNAGERNNALERPFSEFEYPEFIENPEFYLSFHFSQNRFWGDTKQSVNVDFSDKEFAEFHLSEQKAFPANYDFITLPLNDLSADGQKIIDFQPDFTPPRIILREDILNFSSTPRQGWNSTYGAPQTNRDAQYAQVRFRFTDGGQFTQRQGVYLVGDFNQWLLSDDQRLAYNEDSGYWETSALIKEGTYTYKYAIKSGEEIDDLTLSDTITRRDQEYTSFVYYRDPDMQYDRLLQVQFFLSSEN